MEILRSLTIRRNRLDIFAFLFIIGYFIVSLFTINNFPMIFMDEPWLGELSLNLLNNHVSKLSSFPSNGNEVSYNGNLFIILNSISIYLFGFNIFSIRLLTLLSFIGTLVFSYLLIKKLFSDKSAFAFIIIFCLHPYVINSARIARQESFILFNLVLAIYIFYSWKPDLNSKRKIMLGLLFSMPMLSHIMGLISFAIGVLLIIYYENSKSFKSYMVTLLTYLIGAFPIIVIFTYDFFINYETYMNFARNQATLKGIAWKIESYLSYLYLTFNLQSIYVDITYMILLGFLCYGLWILFRLKKVELKDYLAFLMIFGLVNLIIMLLGRYSRFYIIYITYFALVVAVIPISYFKNNRRVISCFPLALVVIGFLIQSILWINYFKDADYSSYSSKVKTYLPKEAIVLGKINYRLSFEKERYIAFEDLLRFVRDGGSFKQYLFKNKVEYIVYDYAWDMKSKQGDLGHGTPYKETQTFLNENCILVGMVNENYYSNRFGPEESSCVFLPYYNLLDVTTKTNLKKSKFWTKIYRVK